jgi:hypothetical protein
VFVPTAQPLSTELVAPLIATLPLEVGFVFDIIFFKGLRSSCFWMSIDGFAYPDTT